MSAPTTTDLSLSQAPQALHLLPPLYQPTASYHLCVGTWEVITASLSFKFGLRARNVLSYFLFLLVYFERFFLLLTRVYYALIAFFVPPGQNVLRLLHYLL